ncbi:MAG: DUF3137 domain-containing protein [Pseudomonadota bacterium]
MAEPFSNDQRTLDRLFDHAIAPKLKGLERDRQAARADRRRRWLTGIGGTLAAMGASSLFGLASGWTPGGHLQSALILTVLGVFGVFAWASLASEEYQDKICKMLVDPLIELEGFERYERSPSVSLDRYENLSIIGTSSSRDLEDLIAGTYRNCRFELFEATLERKSGKNSTTTVFEGQLMQISMPLHIKGSVIITYDYGSWLNSIGGWFRSGTRVEIPHAAFEKDYEVYAEHPEEALKLITPGFVQNFLRLRQLLGSEKITAAFKGDHFYMGVNDGKKIMEKVSINTPAEELRATFHEVADEIAIVHRIIDQLHEPVTTS